MTVFAIAIAAEDSVKYQSFVYASFVWGIQVKYNKSKYVSDVAQSVSAIAEYVSDVTQ